MTLVTEHLEHLGVAFEVLPHVRTETALEQAMALRLDPATVLKAVVLVSATGPAIAIVDASSRVDLDLVREALDDPTVILASEAEIARAYPEFEPGALPALPSLLHVPVVIDPMALAHARVTIAAGVQRESIRLRPTDLLRGGAVMTAPIARSLQGERSPAMA